MCDAIPTARQVDSLPILVELTQYPSELDGQQGHQLARRLSEVASATPVAVASDLPAALGRMRRVMVGVDVALRCGTGADTPAGLLEARSLLVRLAALTVTAIALVEQQSTDLEAEVLRWLRQTIGERMGRTGEAAFASTNPRAHLTRFLSETGVAYVELAIASRWGCPITIGAGDTVEAIAAAIVAALHRQSRAAQEISHVQG